ncbi:amino acid ABC transporter permease [Phaeovulum sp.]|uniref:amino acid ABC transporter permease n=1 Tax=Phaeovulum sp. TaxID=2934796 RepID=UPI0039E6C177
MFSVQTLIDDFWPLILAARFTLLVSGLGIALGLVIGAIVCAMALSKSRAARIAAAAWVSYLRGVPMLVQLLVVFFLLPVIGIDVPAIVAAVGTTGIVASAYISEIWRGAILALPRGQTEAAIAIGIHPRDSWLRIILPQAVALSIPQLINELILLVKASSLVSVVGVMEITRASQAQAGVTFRPLEAYLAAAILYLAINLCLAALGRYLEHRMAV